MDVIGIDEVQFFDKGLLDVCNKLANKGIQIIIAGLDMDYKGNHFVPMPELIASVEFITKVHAICVECGNLVQYSYRKNLNEKKFYLEKQIFMNHFAENVLIKKNSLFKK